MSEEHTESRPTLNANDKAVREASDAVAASLPNCKLAGTSTTLISPTDISPRTSLGEAHMAQPSTVMSSCMPFTSSSKSGAKAGRRHGSRWRACWFRPPASLSPTSDVWRSSLMGSGSNPPPTRVAHSQRWRSTCWSAAMVLGGLLRARTRQSDRAAQPEQFHWYIV
jgi:hypothetical protein